MLGDFAGVTRLVRDAVSVQTQTGVDKRNSSILEAFVRTLRERVINASTESLQHDELRVSLSYAMPTDLVTGLGMVGGELELGADIAHTVRRILGRRHVRRRNDRGRAGNGEEDGGDEFLREHCNKGGR